MLNMHFLVIRAKNALKKTITVHTLTNLTAHTNRGASYEKKLS